VEVGESRVPVIDEGAEDVRHARSRR
jgi:hypothetical protein